jgi:dienelactone hydrolase
MNWDALLSKAPNSNRKALQIPLSWKLKIIPIINMGDTKMIRHLVRSLAAAGVLLIAVSSHAQVTFVSGEAKDSFYQFAVPADWNGTLVIWNHGYSFSPPGPNPDLGPLVDVQLAQGYAVAASSYSQSQWAVFNSRRDIARMVEAFVKQIGKPNNIIMTGASLGGIVTADALERADEFKIDGAFAFCGAMGGSRVWDGAHDIRLTYDAVCSDVAPLPGGATGLPPVPGAIDPTAVAIATNICMGTLTPAQFRTSDQNERLAKFLAVTKIPENFIITDMVFATNGIADLTFDPDKLDGGQGLGNIGVVYDDPDVDAMIRRVKANRTAAKKLKRNFTPRGELENAGVKIVSLHTDKDGLVIVENQSEYQGVVDAGNLSVGVAVEGAPTHCGFSPAELVAGWESLRGWLAGAPQPTAGSLQGTCKLVEATQGGFFPGPCRIDPTFVIPDMDARIAPRDNTRK